MSCISAYAADTGTQIAVVIDSGHGSDESGKETEAEYNKKIAKEIKAYFETYFPSIKESRKGDGSIFLTSSGCYDKFSVCRG